MKDGFTLVEMMAIIVILGIIALVSIPAINSMLEKQTDEAYNNFLNELNLITENYVTVESNINNTLNTNGEVCVTVSDLKKEGYISEEIINPKTDENILDENVIKVKKDVDYNLHFEFFENSVTAGC